MQKKIIALAVAGLMSGAAFAQTNVTIYGVMDVGQAFVKTSGAVAANADQHNVGRLDANASYIGFKGTEDLGNGMKAVFLFENTVNADVGGWGGGRDAYVGLTGNFGTLVGGNLTHPLRAMGAKVDILPGAAGFGSAASITGQVDGAATGADDRAPNAVAYFSPNFSGFQVIGAYVNGEARESAAQLVVAGKSYNSKAWQLAGQYENGPLYVGAGYHKAFDVGGFSPAALANNGGGIDARIWRLAATYKLPFGTTIMGLYDNTKVSGTQNVTRVNTSRTAWSLGAKHGFGAHTVGIQYARSGNVNVIGADAKDAAKLWTLAYEYALSKRTMIHARYSKLANDRAGNSDFYTNPVANGAFAAGATPAGADSTGYMVGLRHTF